MITAAALASAVIAAVILPAVGRKRLASTLAAVSNQNFRWMAFLFSLYFLWALFAQNIDKPRHIVPLVAMLIWPIGCALYKASLGAGRLRAFVLLVSLAAIVTQYAVGAKLLLEQRQEWPSIYQLHHFLERLDNRSFIVYTWEESRVLQYLKADYLHRRVFTYEIFMQEVAAQPGRTVFLTGAVADGFMRQGVDVKRHLHFIGRFASNEIIEPVYNNIALYEWNGE